MKEIENIETDWETEVLLICSWDWSTGIGLFMYNNFGPPYEYGKRNWELLELDKPGKELNIEHMDWLVDKIKNNKNLKKIIIFYRLPLIKKLLLECKDKEILVIDNYCYSDPDITDLLGTEEYNKYESDGWYLF